MWRLSGFVLLGITAVLGLVFYDTIYLNLRSADPLASGWQDYDIQTFSELNASNEPFLVEIYARWCPTCQIQHRAIESIAQSGRPLGLKALRVDFDLVPKVFAAYKRYHDLKTRRENQVERKLVEGDVAFVDNRRVLHGRRAFDPSTGRRHIRTCYGEREELLSSIRMIERARKARQVGQSRSLLHDGDAVA